LAKRDALIRLEGWQVSKGATWEVLRAKELVLPIFDTVGGLAQWEPRIGGRGVIDENVGSGIMVAWDLHDYPLPRNYKEFIVYQRPQGNKRPPGGLPVAAKAIVGT